MTLDSSGLVGAQEAAKIVGVRAPNFIRDWSTRPGFPPPVGSLSRGRVWDRAAVERYVREHGPLRGTALGGLRLSREAALRLPTVKRRLVRRFGPERIVLFGSQANGTATPDSDLDLLIVMPDGVDQRATAIAMRQALADLPVSKDLIVTTRSEIARFGDVVGTMAHEALSSGVTIYARP